MLVEQLSTAYRCHSAIGNSINLKEMLDEVLETFVSESFAIYGLFCLMNEDSIYEKFDSFGKINNFDHNKYNEYKDGLSIVYEKDLIVLKILLDNGFLFLVSKRLDVDCSFFISMFESLIPKLNFTVNACLNYEKLEKSNNLLKKQREELIKANKIKDDFLANMSHELKTPLNSISIISTIMSENKNNKLDSLAVKNIKIIKKCADDLDDIINDILDVSKIEGGELKIYNNNISLKELIQDLYDSFSPIAKSKNIEFINNFQIDNYNIFTDENRIKQIIKNLLSNAFKFTNKGKIKILSKEFEDYIEISVIDSGIGIAKEDLAYIFDRFKQVDNSRSRKYEGTGLGLAISKELATLLNAELCVKSELGIGSTFKYIISKKTYETLLLKHNKEEKEMINNKSNFLFNENFTKKQIYLFHSNNIEQFKLTISLKKYGFNVIPILNEEKLNEKIKNIENNNHLFILDSRINNFENIISDNKLIKLKYLVLKKGEIMENLIKDIKTFQLFNEEVSSGKI